MPRPNFQKNTANQAAAGFIRVKNLKKGDEISGLYLGSYTDKKYGKLNHRIQLQVAATLPVQADKKSPVTKTKFKVGDIIVLNSSGSLDKQLVEYPKNTEMDIVYNGMSTLTSGQFKGEEFHTFEIFHAEGTILGATNGKATDETEEAVVITSTDDADVDF